MVVGFALSAGCADAAREEVSRARQPEADSAEDSGQRPRGLTFPYTVDPACPGEGCAYGTWLACEAIPVYERPDRLATGIQELADEEAFTVLRGIVVVDTPGVVLVEEPRPLVGYGEQEIVFFPGDTIYVLNYVAEGFFNVVHGDSILETEIFWPWESLRVGDTFEYGGRVLQDSRTEFWVQIATTRGVEGWVFADGAKLAAANELVPDPPRCYQ